MLNFLVLINFVLLDLKDVKIKIITFGTKVDQWIENGFEKYRKRLNKVSINIDLVELNTYKHTKKIKNICLFKEEQLILSKITSKDYVVVFDSQGQSVTSQQFSDKFEYWKQRDHVTFIIGGPNGLSNHLKSRAIEKVSLSKLTFPHQLVRIILIEQIYRSWAISSKHPYHK